MSKVPGFVMSEEDTSGLLATCEIVLEHDIELASSKNSIHDKLSARSGIAEFSIDGEEAIRNCRLELDRHVLKVFKEEGEEEKLLVCLNFELYKYTFRFNGTQIVIKSSSEDSSLFMFDIQPCRKAGAW